VGVGKHPRIKSRELSQPGCQINSSRSTEPRAWPHVTWRDTTAECGLRTRTSGGGLAVAPPPRRPSNSLAVAVSHITAHYVSPRLGRPCPHRQPHRLGGVATLKVRPLAVLTTVVTRHKCHFSQCGPTFGHRIGLSGVTRAGSSHKYSWMIFAILRGWGSLHRQKRLDETKSIAPSLAARRDLKCAS